ncbi:macro domain-containing protein [Dactylosporangium sp. NPDC051485]|uniref:macro domain-containing protein n=1 Tax=Dactylosporangium sp. NPDC051485 TaxID=3154846 RepID=UPI00342F3102
MTLTILRDFKTQRFWRILFVQTFAFVGVVAALAGLIDVLKPNAISKVHLPLGWAVGGLALIYGLYRAWPRPVEQRYSKPNTQIRIVEGDLFKQDANLVIGMCDTFDTAVPHIIQAGGVQGQFLSQVYKSDVATLDADITVALAGKEPVGKLDKAGKQDVYPIGTVAVIRMLRRHYFCVAYSRMSAKNQAQATADGIWKSLAALWDEVREHANGDPLAMPVIGGGLSRISQVLPAQDSIRLTALSFIFASRDSRVCDRLDIVVRKEDVKNLDMLELQAFLRSLQEF